MSKQIIKFYDGSVVNGFICVNGNGSVFKGGSI